jgi:hypothetical protein
MLLISLLLTLRDCLRARAALHVELLALRHQIHILTRSRRPRPRLTRTDRLLWIWLSRGWDKWQASLVIVKPETVIAWHGRSFRLFWTWKSRRRVGPRSVPLEVRTLIRTMSDANRPAGAPRVHGELRKLGIDVCQATVKKHMGRQRRPPSQTWRTFLTNHLGQIVAADFFVVPTATCRILFVLVLLAHERRRVVHVAVTVSYGQAGSAARPSGELPLGTLRRSCLAHASSRTREGCLAVARRGGGGPLSAHCLPPLAARSWFEVAKSAYSFVHRTNCAISRWPAPCVCVPHAWDRKANCLHPSQRRRAITPLRRNHERRDRAPRVAHQGPSGHTVLHRHGRLSSRWSSLPRKRRYRLNDI